MPKRGRSIYVTGVFVSGLQNGPLKDGDVMTYELIGIEKQIACVEREIALRRRVYPKFIASGRMKDTTAAWEIAAMEAVLDTLKRQVHTEEAKGRA